MPRPYPLTTKFCALCQTPLTVTNASKEHIFPNAIGGRKTVSDFICRRCNSESGGKWDSELAKQLQPFCTMLDVSRKRGENQPIPVKTVSGRKLIWNTDGSLTIEKPAFDKRIVDDKTHVSIQARSTAELRGILSGLKRTRQELNVEQLISCASSTEEYLHEPLHLSHTFGGELAGRSIIKTCLALAYDAGLSINDCEHARDYLVSNGHVCFGYYNETDPIIHRPDNTTLHCVYVSANAVTGLILAYVEYFGFQKIIACLSSNYHGPPRGHCYAINPVTGEELDIDIVLDLAKDDIAAIYDYKKINYDRARADLENMLSVWYQIDRNRAISGVVDDAIGYACTQMELEPEGIIPEDRVPEFSNLIFRKTAPLLLCLKFGRAFTPEQLRNIDEMLS